MSTAFPIGRLVIIDAGAGGHEAEEDVLRWFDRHPCVTSPNYQVARLRQLDSLKAFDTGVEVRRRRVGIRESGSLVDGMNQMRAVGLGTLADSGVERGGEQRQAV